MYNSWHKRYLFAGSSQQGQRSADGASIRRALWIGMVFVIGREVGVEALTRATAGADGGIGGLVAEHAALNKVSNGRGIAEVSAHIAVQAGRAGDGIHLAQAVAIGRI